MYDVYIDRMVLPIPPEEIEITTNNKNEVVELINANEYNILKEEGLKHIRFKVVIPAFDYPFLNKTQGFNNPRYYLSKLDRLKNDKKVFQFIVSRRYPSNKNYFNTNIKVSLENYSVRDDVNQFMDVVVDVELREFREPRAKKLNMLDDKITGYITTPRPITGVFDRIVTTQTGEHLWNTVRKHTGGIEKLGEIMRLNALDKITDYVPGDNIRMY